MRKVRLYAALVVVLCGSLLLAGCSWLERLPDQERYRYVNQVKDDFGYAEAGEVLDEEYGGKGVASFTVQVKGVDAFDVLSTRAQVLAETKCGYRTTRNISCSVQDMEVTVTPSSIDDNVSVLKITDTRNGRRSE
jgi:hypothetical protein